MNIRKLHINEEPPYDLLLLADPSWELVNRYINYGDSYVIEKDKMIIGVYVLTKINSDTVEIINIAVAEEQQGMGIGKQLLLHAIETAKLNGYKRIEIGTGNSSINQLALYQKCGFRIIGVDIDFYVKNYPNEIYENGIQCRDMIRLSLDLK